MNTEGRFGLTGVPQGDNLENVWEKDFMNNSVENLIRAEGCLLEGGPFFVHGYFYFYGVPWPRAGGGG